MSADWGPGTVILGRYRLDSLLGRGGMGSVWRAEHLQLRSPVAVKLLDSSISSNEQMLARFMREAQSAASLRSPHVVQIFDYGVEAGTAFIAMELLQGESLAERIARLGPLPAEEVVRFLSQVLRAIGKAHETGIVHRDLKPDNIFICADEPEFAKVLDFGVAKVKTGDLSGSAGSRTQTGMMIGTPYYMSPEQTQAKDVDQRADLWAIAVIAYECLVGRRPFTGDSFGELIIAIVTRPVPVPSQSASVPPGFDEWFVKGTQRDRERRFGSAREMADELAKLTGMSGAALRTQPFPVAPATPKVNPLTRSAPRVEGLDLTTGQRAVTSESLSHARPPRGLAVYALVAAAVLIVVGVGAFVATGGASAFSKSGVGPGSAAAALTSAVPTLPVRAAAGPEQPAVAPAPPEPVAAPAEPSPAAPAVSAAAAPRVTAAEPPTMKPSAKLAAKPEPAAKKAPAVAPAVAKSKDPLPPKNWEF
ncbi:MAG TPA: serine/threonine-protein kinase [Polyangiaceae bacterium]